MVKLKHFQESGNIRSIGDAPNGILFVGATTDAYTEATFAVHPSVEASAEDSGTYVVMMTGYPIAEGLAPALTTREVVEAVADLPTLATIWQTVAVGTQIKADEAMHSGRVEPVVAHANLFLELSGVIRDIYGDDLFGAP